MAAQRRRILVCTIDGPTQCIADGNYLAALWALASPRPQWAAIPVGMMVAIKPNFAVWPALLFLAGHRRLALASGGIVAILWALPAVLYGPDIYIQWLSLLHTHASPNTWAGNSSLYGLLGRLDAPLVGRILSVALLVAVAVWAWRVRPTFVRCTVVGISAAMLAAPVAWPGYTLLLWPHLFSEKRSRSRRLIISTLLVVPFSILSIILHYLPKLHLLTGSIYIVPIVMLMIEYLVGPMPLRNRHGKDIRHSPFTALTTRRSQ
ncbi:MAG TPA: DUF2029 domain-containing protein [Chloroflexi bacterium]|jgi:alpha-1,2-mannosyltransferase|nr:DUF2029 domain-containing protein [Chloroflexota bacterium]